MANNPKLAVMGMDPQPTLWTSLGKAQEIEP